MKKMTLTILAVTIAAPLTLFPVHVKADEGKDRCLVFGENCPEQNEGITEKIGRLQKELAKGRVFYAPLELEKLETKLNEYLSMQAVLEQGGE